MLFSIMEMFISFFSGKVMLFYGITLIMKEKSNASALRPKVMLLAAASRRLIIGLRKTAILQIAQAEET